MRTESPPDRRPESPDREALAIELNTYACPPAPPIAQGPFAVFVLLLVVALSVPFVVFGVRALRVRLAMT